MTTFWVLLVLAIAVASYKPALRLVLALTFSAVCFVLAGIMLFVCWVLLSGMIAAAGA
jgi:hypothetical protein